MYRVIKLCRTEISFESKATKKEFQTYQDVKTTGALSQAWVNFHCDIVGKLVLFIFFIIFYTLDLTKTSKFLKNK